MSTTLVILLVLLVILAIAVLFVVSRRRGRAGGVLAQKPRTSRDRPESGSESDVA
jgi:hypothetical protein